MRIEGAKKNFVAQNGSPICAPQPPNVGRQGT